jgi:Fe-Mn family superoxide dismutase
MHYELPKLPYAFDALEPYIDARTMEIHHDKHHAAYVTNLNKAIEGQNLGNPTIEELLSAINTLPDAIRTAVRNHGGGHANHSMFWLLLKRDGGEPKGELATAIDKHFGNFAGFRDAFTKAAMGRFGSGWAWLSLDPNKKLLIESSGNQDSPIMNGNTPILGIDVWEHAYYLKYQNRRADYVDAFYHAINWDAVAENFDSARKHSGQYSHSGANS